MVESMKSVAKTLTAFLFLVDSLHGEYRAYKGYGEHTGTDDTPFFSMPFTPGQRKHVQRWHEVLMQYVGALMNRTTFLQVFG